MKCLTVRQPFAHQIMTGQKTIEYRTWKTPHRGALLIHVSSKVRLTRVEARANPSADQYGVILGVVDLVDIEGEEGAYEWILENPRPLALPVRTVGKLGLWAPSPELLTQLRAAGLRA